MWCHRFLFVLAVTTAFPLYAQDDDDDQPPGLVARYEVNGSSVERVDPDLSFNWSSSPPDERLPAGKFTAHWRGTLLLRSAEKYRFHASIQGRVSVSINEQVVLSGESAEPVWISGPNHALSFGDQPLEISFTQTEPTAQFKLYWSSSDFPLEPVPYHVLFQTEASPQLRLVERGRAHYESFRCGHCHQGAAKEQASRLAAPSLMHLGSGTYQEWIVEKLMQSGDPKSPGNMPHFGFSKDEAEAIASTLFSKSVPVELMAPGTSKASDRQKDVQAGRMLIRTLGCLACHTWESFGEETAFGGGNLDNLSRKRSSAWLTTWLSDPSKLNSNHRMPTFSLSGQERTQIVLALLGSAVDSGVPAFPPANQDLDLGHKLIQSARCSQCHGLPTPKVSTPATIRLSDPKVDWSKSCSAKPDRSKLQPGYPKADLTAIKAYLATWKIREPLPVDEKSSLAGRRVLEQRNCLGCHDRDGDRGLSKTAARVAASDEQLTGQQMTLIPPRLNAVGDRMHDAGLGEAIRGEQKSPRLNWLRVRMPKFRHSPGDQAALMSHLIEHDRIPPGAPETAAQRIGIEANQKLDSQRQLAGRELLGGKGFSCVACHAVKDYTPKVTALGTRGSNLYLIGQRMRTDYFFRWTRAPLRVMPGVEMPNYQRPHEFILPGKLDQQLIAIWEALNDPNLTAPTNAAVVEQLLTVNDDGEPRVVRDVMTVPGKEGETVARPCAIGLAGGHSLLFDLDTCSVRGWTLGEFARQRCEGKRWYWDLAGTVLAAGFDKRPDLVLVNKQTSEVLAPETGWTVESRLISDSRMTFGEVVDKGVELKYSMIFNKGGVSYEIGEVRDQFYVVRQSGKEQGDNGPITGWKRQTSIPANGTFHYWMRTASPEYVHVRASVNQDQSDRSLAGLSTNALPFTKAANGSSFAMTTYQTDLRWEKTKIATAPEIANRANEVTTVPGYRGMRLPLPRSIMPTALTWDSQHRLLFTSLKGHLYELQEREAATPSLKVLEEGLAAPFGVIQTAGEGAERRLVVAHKPELLRLVVRSDGVSSREVVASGWGVTDDYHDWTCGIVQDSTDRLYIGLGSDYTFKNRPATRSRWRGDILRIDREGNIESIARGLRYPTGLAIDDQDRLFCTDQQGVQNTFNELNLIVPGHRYGVPSRHEPEPGAVADPPAVQIPHPWTRSVNGITFVSRIAVERHNGKRHESERAKADAPALAALMGHFLACEYNNNMLIRMSVQTVGDVVQGAVYPFSKPAKEGETSNFVGPLCIGISPEGDIYVGGFQDGGWVGGLNMGDIVKLSPEATLPNGIREIRATKSGFDIEFFHPIDPNLSTTDGQFKISGYTRVWKGDYATPDSGHHKCDVTKVSLSEDHKTVNLTVTGRLPGHVYDVSVGEIGTESQRTLWPSIGHFTLHRIPEEG